MSKTTNADSYRLALAMLQEKRWPEALQLLRDVLLVNSYHVEARIHLARCLRELGRLSQSESEYRSLLLEDPANSAIRCCLARVIFDQGRSEEAIAEYRKSCEVMPEYLPGQYHLANKLRLMGQHSEAAHLYARLVHANYRELACRICLAQCLTSDERQHEALTHYRHALGLDPKCSVAACGAASILWRSGRVAEAKGVLKSALDRQPHAGMLHYFLGICYFEAAEFREALAHFQTARQNGYCTTGINIRIANCFWMSGGRLRGLYRLFVELDVFALFEIYRLRRRGSQTS